MRNKDCIICKFTQILFRTKYLIAPEGQQTTNAKKPFLDTLASSRKHVCHEDRLIARQCQSVQYD